MKHSEKEHLKENEVAHALGIANQNRTQLLTIIGGIFVLLVAVGGFVTWQRNKDSAVSGLLADAMVVYESPVQAPTPGSPQAPGTYPTEKAKLEAALPKFLAAAESSPSSTPGRLARLNAAATLVGLGRFDEARTHYEQLATGTDLVASGAALGKAQALARAGQYGPAIEALKTLSAQTTTPLPADGVLMELARAYRESGKTDDARKTLQEIVDKHADSPFAAEARS
ncbi:MAG: tetratricopeptide repeat protein, partial [Acidobacteria bacterium]|nr:tetratricopeptide repeat protein [Acidobacteriota bacterium]